MKLVPVILLLSSVIGSGNSDPAEGARSPKHLILPFFGYQTLNAEQVGVSYTALVNIQLMDSTIAVISSENCNHDQRAPLFGVLYRYTPSPGVSGELSLAVIHNKGDLEYEFEVPIYGYIQRYFFTVKRGNTLVVNFDLLHHLHTPARWLGVNARAGFGYASRSLKLVPPSEVGVDLTLEGKIRDARRMYIGRIGADFSIWKGDQMVIEGSMFYTRFIPFGADTDPFIPGYMDPDPFGGFSWRLSFFPIWGDR